MVFEYQALNSKGDNVSDLVEAPSEAAARTKLRSDGLYVVRIRRHEIAEEHSPSRRQGLFGRLYAEINTYLGTRFSSRQVGLFSRQLSTLLGAGMPLIATLNAIIDQIDNQMFRRIVVDIREKIEEGSSFSNALVRHKAIFSDMYINMVRVGENLGSLDQVVERLADMEEKRSMLKGKVQSALWYPSFMILFATAVIAFILVKIVPSLSRMFTDMGRELPVPTQIVIAVSDFLSAFWYVLIIIAVLVAYYLRQYSKTAEGRRKLDELKLSTPLFRNLYRKLIVLRFTQNLGVLLNNKVDILKSFEIVKKIVGNVVVEKKIEEAAVRIREGATVSTALGRSDFLPKMVLGMIAAGEASDKLDTMLVNIGRVYENELDLTITGLTSLIEPVIIVLMGVAIGTIVVSVLLPIFEMNLIVQ
jgi:general secretion pathway protein F